MAPISNATRLADFGSGIGTEGAVLKIDNDNNRVGIGSTVPASLLQVGLGITIDGTGMDVSGIITAKQFIGGGINTAASTNLTHLTVSGVTTFSGDVLVGSSATVGFGSTVFFKDGNKLYFGNGEDLSIYHDGSHSYIDETGTGGLFIDASVLTLRNANDENYAIFTSDGSTDLYFNNSKKFETTNSGSIITGILTVTSDVSIGGTLTYEDVTNIDSVGVVTARAGVNVSGGQLLVGSGITMGIAGVATFSGTSDVHLTDGVKLLVGDGSDLKIFHDGSHSYVQDSGTGDLLIDGSIVKLRNAGGTKNYAVATDGSSIDLYFNNSKKFETTNDGTVTTGIATATGLDVADKITHTGDTNTAIRFTGADTISLETGGVQALEITSSQIIKIPGQLTGNNVAQILNHSDGFNFYGSSDSNTPNDFIFCAASSAASEKFRITDTGQVGINSAAPNFDLDIRGGGGRDGVSVGTTVFIYSNQHATNISNKAELRFGFNHSGNNYAYGNIFLEEQGGNAFDGRMSFGVPYNNGGGGSSTRHVLQLQGSTGNVGIGTTIPVASDSNYNSAALHIHQTTVGDGSQIHLTNAATGGAAANGAHISMWSDDDLYITNQESDGQLKFETAGTTRFTIDDSGNATFNEDVTFTGASYSALWDKSQNRLEFPDNAAVMFGTGEDLLLYTNGSDSYIDHSGDGDLYIRTLGSQENIRLNAAKNVELRISSGNDLAIKCNVDESVDLYYNNSAKFSTTNDGTVTTGISTATSFKDDLGSLRTVPKNNQTGAYVLVAGDVGKTVYISTGGVTINNSIFSSGDLVTIINNSGSTQTITQGSSFTLYNTTDAATGNKTLNARGICTVWFADHNEAYISGNFA